MDVSLVSSPIRRGHSQSNSDSDSDGQISNVDLMGEARVAALNRLLEASPSSDPLENNSDSDEQVSSSGSRRRSTPSSISSRSASSDSSIGITAELPADVRKKMRRASVAGPPSKTTNEAAGSPMPTIKVSASTVEGTSFRDTDAFGDGSTGATPSQGPLQPTTPTKRKKSTFHRDHTFSLREMRIIKAKFDKYEAVGGMRFKAFIREIGPLVRRKAKDVTLKDMETLFKRIDANANGSVDWLEIAEFLLMNDVKAAVRALGYVNLRRFEKEPVVAHDIDHYEDHPALRYLAHQQPMTRIVPFVRGGNAVGLELAKMGLDDGSQSRGATVHKNAAPKSAELPTNRIARYFTCSLDGTAKMWNSDTLRHERTFHTSRSPVVDMCHTTWHDAIAVLGMDFTVFLYSPVTGEMLRAYKGERKRRAVAVQAATSARGGGVGGSVTKRMIDDRRAVVYRPQFVIPLSSKELEAIKYGEDAKAFGVVGASVPHLAHFVKDTPLEVTGLEDLGWVPEEDLRENREIKRSLRREHRTSRKGFSRDGGQSPLLPTSGAPSPLPTSPATGGDTAATQYLRRHMRSDTLSAHNGGGRRGAATRRRHEQRKKVDSDAERPANAGGGSPLSRHRPRDASQSRVKSASRKSPQHNATAALEGDPDNRLVSTGYPRCFATFTNRSSQEKAAKAYDPSYSNLIHPTRPRMLFGLDSGHLQVYEFDAPTMFGLPLSIPCLATIRVHHAAITSLKVCEVMSLVFTASADGTIQVRHWDRLGEHGVTLGEGLLMAGDSANIQTVDIGARGHTKPICSMDWSLKARLLASCARERDTLLWSPYITKPVMKLDGNPGTRAISVSFSEPAFVLTVLDSDRGVKVWDMRSYRCIHSLTDAPPSRLKDLLGVALYDDAQDCVVLGTTILRKWRVERQSTYSVQYNGHRKPVVGMAFSSQFNQLITADDRQVVVWDVFNGFSSLMRWSVPEGITHISLDDNERRLLVATEVGTIRMFNYVNGQLLRTCIPRSGPRAISQAALSRLIEKESGTFNDRRTPYQRNWLQLPPEPVPQPFDDNSAANGDLVEALRGEQMSSAKKHDEDTDLAGQLITMGTRVRKGVGSGGANDDGEVFFGEATSVCAGQQTSPRRINFVIATYESGKVAAFVDEDGSEAYPAKIANLANATMPSGCGAFCAHVVAPCFVIIGAEGRLVSYSLDDASGKTSGFTLISEVRAQQLLQLAQVPAEPASLNATAHSADFGSGELFATGRRFNLPNASISLQPPPISAAPRLAPRDATRFVCLSAVFPGELTVDPLPSQKWYLENRDDAASRASTLVLGDGGSAGGGKLEMASHSAPSVDCMVVLTSLSPYVVVTGSSDGLLQLWSGRTQSELFRMKVPIITHDAITSLLISPGEDVLLVGDSGGYLTAISMHRFIRANSDDTCGSELAMGYSPLSQSASVGATTKAPSEATAATLAAFSRVGHVRGGFPAPPLPDKRTRAQGIQTYKDDFTSSPDMFLLLSRRRLHEGSISHVVRLQQSSDANILKRDVPLHQVIDETLQKCSAVARQSFAALHSDLAASTTLNGTKQAPRASVARVGAMFTPMSARRGSISPSRSRSLSRSNALGDTFFDEAVATIMEASVPYVFTCGTDSYVVLWDLVHGHGLMCVGDSQLRMTLLPHTDKACGLFDSCRRTAVLQFIRRYETITTRKMRSVLLDTIYAEMSEHDSKKEALLAVQAEVVPSRRKQRVGTKRQEQEDEFIRMEGYRRRYRDCRQVGAPASAILAFVMASREYVANEMNSCVLGIRSGIPYKGASPRAEGDEFEQYSTEAILACGRAFHPHTFVSTADAVQDVLKVILESMTQPRSVGEFVVARGLHRKPLQFNKMIASPPSPTAPPPADSTVASRRKSTTLNPPRSVPTRSNERDEEAEMLPPRLLVEIGTDFKSQLFSINEEFDRDVARVVELPWAPDAPSSEVLTFAESHIDYTDVHELDSDVIPFDRRGDALGASVTNLRGSTIGTSTNRRSFQPPKALEVPIGSPLSPTEDGDLERQKREASTANCSRASATPDDARSEITALFSPMGAASGSTDSGSTDEEDGGNAPSIPGVESTVNKSVAMSNATSGGGNLGEARMVARPPRYAVERSSGRVFDPLIQDVLHNPQAVERLRSLRTGDCAYFDEPLPPHPANSAIPAPPPLMKGFHIKMPFEALHKQGSHRALTAFERSELVGAIQAKFSSHDVALEALRRQESLVGSLILRFGTPAQKVKYLPRFLEVDTQAQLDASSRKHGMQPKEFSRWRGAFCLAEPGVVADVFNMNATGVPVTDASVQAVGRQTKPTSPEKRRATFRIAPRVADTASKPKPAALGRGSTISLVEGLGRTASQCPTPASQALHLGDFPLNLTLVGPAHSAELHNSGRLLRPAPESFPPHLVRGTKTCSALNSPNAHGEAIKGTVLLVFAITPVPAAANPTSAPLEPFALGGDMAKSITLDDSNPSYDGVHEEGEGSSPHGRNAPPATGPAATSNITCFIVDTVEHAKYMKFGKWDASNKASSQGRQFADARSAPFVDVTLNDLPVSSPLNVLGGIGGGALIAIEAMNEIKAGMLHDGISKEAVTAELLRITHILNERSKNKKKAQLAVYQRHTSGVPRGEQGKVLDPSSPSSPRSDKDSAHHHPSPSDISFPTLVVPNTIDHPTSVDGVFHRDDFGSASVTSSLHRALSKRSSKVPLREVDAQMLELLGVRRANDPEGPTTGVTVSEEAVLLSDQERYERAQLIRDVRRFQVVDRGTAMAIRNRLEGDIYKMMVRAKYASTGAGEGDEHPHNLDNATQPFQPTPDNPPTPRPKQVPVSLPRITTPRSTHQQRVPQLSLGALIPLREAYHGPTVDTTPKGGQEERSLSLMASTATPDSFALTPQPLSPFDPKLSPRLPSVAIHRKVPALSPFSATSPRSAGLPTKSMVDKLVLQSARAGTHGRLNETVSARRRDKEREAEREKEKDASLSPRLDDDDSGGLKEGDGTIGARFAAMMATAEKALEEVEANEREEEAMRERQRQQTRASIMDERRAKRERSKASSSLRESRASVAFGDQAPLLAASSQPSRGNSSAILPAAVYKAARLLRRPIHLKRLQELQDRDDANNAPNVGSVGVGSFILTAEVAARMMEAKAKKRAVMERGGGVGGTATTALASNGAEEITVIDEDGEIGPFALPPMEPPNKSPRRRQSAVTLVDPSRDPDLEGERGGNSVAGSPQEPTSTNHKSAMLAFSDLIVKEAERIKSEALSSRRDRIRREMSDLDAIGVGFGEQSLLPGSTYPVLTPRTRRAFDYMGDVDDELTGKISLWETPERALQQLRNTKGPVYNHGSANMVRRAQEAAGGAAEGGLGSPLHRPSSLRLSHSQSLQSSQLAPLATMLAKAEELRREHLQAERRRSSALAASVLKALPASVLFPTGTEPDDGIDENDPLEIHNKDMSQRLMEAALAHLLNEHSELQKSSQLGQFASVAGGGRSHKDEEVGGALNKTVAFLPRPPPVGAPSRAARLSGSADPSVPRWLTGDTIPDLTVREREYFMTLPPVEEGALVGGIADYLFTITGKDVGALGRVALGGYVGDDANRALLNLPHYQLTPAELEEANYKFAVTHFKDLTTSSSAPGAGPDTAKPNAQQAKHQQEHERLMTYLLGPPSGGTQGRSDIPSFQAGPLWVDRIHSELDLQKSLVPPKPIRTDRDGGPIGFGMESVKEVAVAREQGWIKLLTTARSRQNTFESNQLDRAQEGTTHRPPGSNITIHNKGSTKANSARARIGK